MFADGTVSGQERFNRLFEFAASRRTLTIGDDLTGLPIDCLDAARNLRREALAARAELDRILRRVRHFPGQALPPRHQLQGDLGGPSLEAPALEGSLPPRRGAANLRLLRLLW